ncbi:MAG: hypothetical protein H7221_10860 [Flavobacterium sp.]|nr:hypothetical protein [Flavobacterium sp.]
MPEIQETLPEFREKSLIFREKCLNFREKYPQTGKNASFKRKKPEFQAKILPNRQKCLNSGILDIKSNKKPENSRNASVFGFSIWHICVSMRHICVFSYNTVPCAFAFLF